MVKKSSICSSVEGEKLSFNTRQFYSKTPVINGTLGVKVYPFKLGINGYVEIESPLETPSNAVYSTSLTSVGDAVQGGSIDGWSTKPIKAPSKGPATGTHSAVFGSLRGHSYAHVESSHRDHLQSKDIQARNPEIVAVLNPLYIADNSDEILKKS